jgi:hypothetical protein
MFRRISRRAPLPGALAHAFALLIPGLALAQGTSTPQPVYISILDNTDALTASMNAPNGAGGMAGTYIAESSPASVKGFSPAATAVLTNEIPGASGQLGAFDAHFEYLSANPLANGFSVTKNFNIFGAVGGPEPGELSDTLSIFFTGQTPSSGDLNNMSVDLHFRSDNETIGLPPLTSAVSVNELTALPGYVDLSSQIAGGGIQTGEFNLRFASTDIPEPGPIALAAVGGAIAGVVAWCRRRATRQRAPRAAA